MKTSISKIPRQGLPHWALFAIGLATMFRIEMQGYLFGSEILLIVFAIGLLVRRKDTSLLRPILLTLIALSILCAAIVITDLWRNVPFENSVKGVALYAVLGLEVAGIYVVCSGNPYGLMTLLTGISVGTILQFALFGGFKIELDPWKFAYGTPLTVVICIAAGRVFGVSLKTAGILVVMAAVNLYLDYRGLAGLCAIAAAGVVATPFVKRQFGRPSLKALAVASIAGLAFVPMLFLAYEASADSGLLNRQAEYRYQIQKEAVSGPLLAARGALVGTIEAIEKSPFVGRGSSPVDVDIAARTAYLIALFNPMLSYHTPSSALISIHSFLLGAWVQIGILGGLFWMVWFVLGARSAVYALWLPSGLVAGWLLFILLELWSILFSPFGGFERLNAAIAINFIISVLSLRLKGQRYG